MKIEYPNITKGELCDAIIGDRFPYDTAIPKTFLDDIIDVIRKDYHFLTDDDIEQVANECHHQLVCGCVWAYESPLGAIYPLTHQAIFWLDTYKTALKHGVNTEPRSEIIS